MAVSDRWPGEPLGREQVRWRDEDGRQRKQNFARKPAADGARARRGDRRTDRARVSAD